MSLEASHCNVLMHSLSAANVVNSPLNVDFAPGVNIVGGQKSSRTAGASSQQLLLQQCETSWAKTYDKASVRGMCCLRISHPLLFQDAI